MTVYPTSALRTVVLRTQGLHTANDISTELRPTRDNLYEMVNQIGCVQIDTLHMVRRSQYLVLWSRLGKYDPADFDALTSAADRLHRRAADRRGPAATHHGRNVADGR